MRNPQDIYTPPGGPPPVQRPDPAIYQAMGTDNIYAMLEAFYLRLEASPIRDLFPPDMRAASRKSGAFFVFLLGGPPLYQQQYGPPMMRARHLPFRIDEQARVVWLDCFKAVLAEAPEQYGFPEEHLPGFVAFIEGFSTWMVNAR